MLTLGAAMCAAQPVAAQAVEAQEAEAGAGAAPAAQTVEFEGPYQPTDELERSLWLQMDEYERTLKSSKQVIDDPQLNAYIRAVLCRTVGPECEYIRLYVLRSPQFNATMAPNGAMTVWSGLLLRAQNEAQLAAVLGHEFAHFKRRHSLQLFRKAKEKSNAAAWLAFTGVGLLFSVGMLNSIFKFSREMEEQADIDGLKLIADAGYDASQVPLIWEQLLDERDATLEARGRKKKKRKIKAGLFATHPPSQARVEYLQAAVAELGQVDADAGEEAYQLAMSRWWPQFLDDQLKMNDDGGSSFLIDSMVNANGWTPWLSYARAEFHRRRGDAGDFDTAIGHYSDAIERGGQLPELWRGRGYALRKAGRKEEAKADFREYLKRVPDAPDRAMVSMLAGGVS
ncbi:MAG: M48 family metallopeptidase [Pseudomonadota bacterium]|nr:M48 family metallopeptidase [Pseudomonadota bacterium]